MAERTEEPETELDISSEPISPASAIAIGLHKGRRRAATDPEFDAFLKDQRELINLQKEHLHEQRAVILARLRLGRFSDWMKALLQVLTVLVGLAIVAAIAVMAWQAHEDHGVAIQAFSVPPDFAQRGLTGEVVAGQLLDKLTELQARTVTNRPASTYANDWGDDIKVEIPETGVSIGELSRYLRDWLGSEIRISGAVVRTPAGVAVTARAGDVPAQRFEGPEADVDKLIAQAAEALYAHIEPYRYAVYLASEGETDEALAAYTRLAASGDPNDRAWAYLGWSTLLLYRGDMRAAAARASDAIAIDRWIDPAYAVQASADADLGREKDGIASTRAAIQVLGSGRAEGLSPAAARARRDYVRAVLAGAFGDYAQAITMMERMPMRMSMEGGGNISSQEETEDFLIRLHDIAAARRLALTGAPRLDLRMEAAEVLDDWRAALSLFDQMAPAEKSYPAAQAGRALLLARIGRGPDAQVAIAPTPLDCWDCLLARGEVAARANDRKGADRWFAEAVEQAQAPDASLAWGASLLLLHDPDAAIVELRQAHKLGPHYGDPLEVWGEALMAKHDYAGAVSKFTEADKDAPKWGRNHLRWGEALMLSGRYGEARAQYRLANGLDLSKPDRAALNVLLARTASGQLHG